MRPRPWTAFASSVFIVGLAVLATVAPRAAARARAEEVVKRIGRVTVRVDASRAFPGGVLVVRLSSTARLGACWALLDGRRASFYGSAGGPKALVPVAVGTDPGPATLGVGIAARRGEQRIAVPVEIKARAYPRRQVAMPASADQLLARAEVGRDARRLLACIRSQSHEFAPVALRPPVAGTAAGFGEWRTPAGLPGIESRIDALGGEWHRGLDYVVPLGTPVRAPAGGAVVFAGSLVLSGQTIVIDHGQGVVSVLLHLSRLDVNAGDRVPAGAPLGLSGESRLAAGPLLEWRVYLHGLAVDPLVLGSALG